MMADDVPDEAGTENKADEPCQFDGKPIVLDVVTLEAFLAALRQYKPPNERLLTLVRTPAPETD